MEEPRAGFKASMGAVIWLRATFRIGVTKALTLRATRTPTFSKSVGGARAGDFKGEQGFCGSSSFPAEKMLAGGHL